MGRKCNDCLYWEHDGDPESTAGECHRYPPVIKDDLSESWFPVVQYEDWCGEWKPLEQQ